jgi:uncharacterized membrane protein YvbJ
MPTDIYIIKESKKKFCKKCGSFLNAKGECRKCQNMQKENNYKDAKISVLKRRLSYLEIENDKLRYSTKIILIFFWVAVIIMLFANYFMIY